MRPIAVAFLALFAASPLVAQQAPKYKTTGKITVSDPALRDLIDETAPIEIISEGYNWSEGPLWVQDSTVAGGGFLIWSDVPENRIFKSKVRTPNLLSTWNTPATRASAHTAGNAVPTA